MNLNKVMLIGNLTRNPETRTTPTGQTVCSFGLATNRRYNDAQGNKQDQAEFHNLVAWGRLAEICGQYLVKGKKIYAEGRLQTRKWTAQDGSEKQRTEIVLEGMQMLDRAGAGGSASTAARAAEPSFPAANPEPGVPDTAEEGIKVEEIPF
ncbi:single-stranded DNA-binding protein [Candidatus Uhrbacteria bacterium]|nr:single-stranded DNA-binding protein [Candidatus Uhrbacteria bacterium]